ncbi:MAG: right-handed parallel beta-helix repeat-containing protein [Desulfobacteraceae bacterium]|nr:right-handed parallel beta-helix repeat-containing protein [Desulfobacteraceae bacterium]
MRSWSVLSQRWLFLAVASLLVLCASYARGATITVPDQYATVQAGIDAASNGDTVVVRDGTYALTAPVTFDGKAITVRSANGAANCILDGQKQTRVLIFNSYEGRDSVLSGFTIQNGYADMGGGIYIDSSSPTIEECVIRGNQAADDSRDINVYGGGIYCASASPSIANCTISNNKALAPWDAAAYGGGMYYSASSPEIQACSVTGNTATGSDWYEAGQGGGIYFLGGSPTVTDSMIDSNIASGGEYGSAHGGGIYAKSSSPSFDRCSISNNSASNADKAGGGAYFLQSFPSILNSVVSANAANDGAAIFFRESSAAVTNCTIVRNTATSGSGGIHLAESSPAIVNSILWSNTPTEIYKADSTSDPTVSFSDVSGGYDGTGNIDEEPYFVSLANKDFHLQSTSPCIDSGDTTIPDLTETDRDGNARVVNHVVDIGAYEYQEPTAYGAIKATLSPATAVTAGAMWNVDEGTWQASGATVANLAAGTHTVCFQTISGWTPPACQSVTVKEGLTTPVKGTYTQEVGKLKITLQPSKVRGAGGRWQVDGGSWMSSGATVAKLSVGTHTVCFKDVSGWTTPGCMTVTVKDGETTSATATYIQQMGSLKVTIDPAGAVSAGAKWKVDSGAWQESGTTLSNIAAGTHKISFKSVTGWTTPATQIVTVSKDATREATGTYVIQLGSLKVTISPEDAVDDGAQWNVDGGAWQASGVTMTGLTAGKHTVAFKSASGWKTPANKTVTISKNKVTTASGTYRR